MTCNEHVQPEDCSAFSRLRIPAKSWQLFDVPQVSLDEDFKPKIRSGSAEDLRIGTQADSAATEWHDEAD